MDSNEERLLDMLTEFMYSYRSNVDSSMISTYQKFLKNENLDILKDALDMVVINTANNGFIPPIANIKEAINAVKHKRLQGQESKRLAERDRQKETGECTTCPPEYLIEMRKSIQKLNQNIDMNRKLGLHTTERAQTQGASLPIDFLKKLGIK